MWLFRTPINTCLQTCSKATSYTQFPFESHWTKRPRTSSLREWVLLLASAWTWWQFLLVLLQKRKRKQHINYSSKPTLPSPFILAAILLCNLFSFLRPAFLSVLCWLPLCMDAQAMYYYLQSVPMRDDGGCTVGKGQCSQRWVYCWGKGHTVWIREGSAFAGFRATVELLRQQRWRSVKERGRERYGGCRHDAL